MWLKKFVGKIVCRVTSKLFPVSTLSLKGTMHVLLRFLYVSEGFCGLYWCALIATVQRSVVVWTAFVNSKFTKKSCIYLSLVEFAFLLKRMIRFGVYGIVVKFKDRLEVISKKSAWVRLLSTVIFKSFL